jgi:hypothetical protein
MQFISETLIITLFAIALALCMAEIALPMLNKLLEIKLSAAFLSDPVLLLFYLQQS